MALSGSFTTTANVDSGYSAYFTFSWTSAPNIANNTSTISWKWTFNNTHGSSYYRTVYHQSLTAGGATRYSSTSQTNIYGGTQVASGSFVVTHNSDGSGSFAASATCGISSSSNNSTGSATFTLNTIARATKPTLSANNVALGSTVTINLPRASSSFTHTLTVAQSGQTTTVGTGLGTSASFTLPTTWADLATSLTNMYATFTCTTYNGSTNIGSATVRLDWTVPSTAEYLPVIDSTTIAEATSGLAGVFGAFIQSKSTLALSCGASGKHGATISSYSITANGQLFNTSTATTKALSGSGQQSAVFTATDSRGKSSSKTVTYSVLPYSPPQITSVSFARANADGSDNLMGTYVKAVVSASISPLDNKNTKSFVVSWLARGATGSWSSQNVTPSGAAYTMEQVATVLSPFSTASPYDIKLVVTDYFAVATIAGLVPTALVPMNFYPGGKGLAIGKIAESEGLEIAMPTNVRSGNSFALGGYPIVPGALCCLGISSSITLTNTTTPYVVNCQNLIACIGDIITPKVSSAGNGGITVKKSGLYEITTNLTYASISPSATIYVGYQIYRGGVLFQTSWRALINATSATCTVNATYPLQMIAGDELYMAAYRNSSAAITTYNSPPYSYMFAKLVQLDA